MYQCVGVLASDGSGSKIFDPSQVNFLWLGLGQPWKISTKNVKFSNFFPFGSKKISSGWLNKYPGRMQVGLLFTAGQK